MPRFFEPEVDTVGPLGKKAKASVPRRGRKQGRGSRWRSKPLPPAIASFDKAPESPIAEVHSPHERQRLQSYIGQDLLELVPRQEEDAAVAAAVPTTFGERLSSASVRQHAKAKKYAATISSSKSATLQHAPSTEVTPLATGFRTSYPAADTNNTAGKYRSSLPHALAIDTRWLVTHESRERSPIVAERAVRDMHDWIRTLQVRGAPPCLVATTEKKSKGAHGVVVHPGTAPMTKLLEPIFVPAQHVNANDQLTAVSIPQALTAEHSWSHFGDMGMFPVSFCCIPSLFSASHQR